MEKRFVQHTVCLESASNFETILTVRELSAPTETLELKFEAVFTSARDAQARQTKAQFFVDRYGLQRI